MITNRYTHLYRHFGLDAPGTLARIGEATGRACRVGDERAQPALRSPSSSQAAWCMTSRSARRLASAK